MDGGTLTIDNIHSTPKTTTTDKKSLLKTPNLKRHTFLMKLEENPMCDCQEGEETTIHVLTDCPLHARNRWHYLGKATLKEEDMKTKSLTQILKFARATKKWALQPD